MNSILFLLGLGLIVWFWQSNLRYREFAILQCKRFCNEMNIQLLDQTVTLASLSLARNHLGKLRPRRKYNFEVSNDGVKRHRGCIILLGFRVIHTEFNLPDGTVILQENPVQHTSSRQPGE